MALKDTLVRLKRQQENNASFEAEKPHLRDEWINAVTSLAYDFKDFLSAFVADGSLILSDHMISLSEDLVGTYTVPAVTVEAGPAKIELVPVGRIVVGAVGRVDLTRQGYAGSSQRILILRFRDGDDGVSRWMLRLPVEVGAISSDDFRNHTRQFTPDFVSFDRENLERAIDFLLSLS